MAARLKSPFVTRDPHICISSRPIQPFHFQADLIWCDGTFMKTKREGKYYTVSQEVNIYPIFFYLTSNYSRLLMREKLTWLRRAREAKCGNSFRRTPFICLLSLKLCSQLKGTQAWDIFFFRFCIICKPVHVLIAWILKFFPLLFVTGETSFSLSESTSYLRLSKHGTKLFND